MKKRRSPTRKLFAAFISVLLAAVVYFLPKDNPLSALVEKTTAASPSASQAESQSEELIVTRVIDGDTFLLSNGEKVRLTGIDTPESNNNPKALKDSERSGQDVGAITRQGKEAAQFTKKLAEGKKIRIEYDVQKRDRYGRLLVYAYDIDTLKRNPQTKVPEGLVVSANKEIFLNGSIISSGYAVPLTIPPNVKHADQFKKLYSEARSGKRGLWAQ